MNLITDPWIPVLFENGSAKLVGLEQLYREAESIRDLNVNPPQRIALMRLLLCITQTALDGPENEEDWKTCRERIVSESLAYLLTRKDKFELYGETPFLQVGTLIPTNNESIEKLDAALFIDLFNHTTIPNQTDASIALNLLTTQCFSLCGTIGVSSWNGYSTKTFMESTEIKGPGPSSDAPCAPSSMLHSIVRGESILHSIHNNLLIKNELSQTWGLPIWDVDLSSPVKAQADSAPTYLGRLVPLSRGILLDKAGQCCTYVAGIKYESLPAYREPMGTVLLNKKNEPFYMGIQPEQHVWRELGSILSLNVKSESHGALALARTDLIQSEKIDLWVGGVHRKSGKNTVLDMLEWNFSIPVSMLHEVEIDKYSKGVELANEVAWVLKNSIQTHKKSYSKELKTDGASHVRKATVQYWSTLDSGYQMLVEIASDQDRNLDDWRNLLRKTMHEAFEQACPHETPRQIKAFVQAKRLLEIKEKKRAE